MPPDFHIVLSPDRLSQAVIVFMLAGVALLLTLFIHTAASEWFRIARTQRRAHRIDRRIEDQARKS